MLVSTPQLLQTLQKMKSSRSEVINVICTLIKRIDRPIWFGTHSCKLFIDNRGIKELLNILELYKGDSTVVKIIFEAFVILIERDRTNNKDNSQTALILNRLTQSRIIEEVFKEHNRDKDIRVWGRFVIRNLERASALATIAVLGEIDKAFELGISYETLKEVYSSRTNTCDAADNNTCTLQKINCTNEEKMVFDNDNPCQTGIKIVIKVLSEYPDNETIQRKGLQIILQSILISNTPFNTFVNKECASVIIAAIDKFDVYQVQWRALTAMMALTSNLRMCAHFRKEGGCDVIMKILEQNVKDKSISQIAIWTLNHLFKEEYSRQRLIDRGLKVFLHGLLIKHSNTSKESSICPSIVIPVELRRLYMMTDLESAKRVGVKPSSVEPDETKKVNKGLPLLKNLRPAHGTVKDLFIDGYPGLIQS